MMENRSRKAKMEKRSKGVISFRCTSCNDRGLCQKTELKKPCGICNGSRIQTK